MSVIIRLQGLPWSASAMNIRHFFSGLSIPAGGVHIIGGDGGDAFIAFSSDDDARMAMKKNMCPLNGTPVQLFLSSKAEMQSVIDAARSGNSVAATTMGSGGPANTPEQRQQFSNMYGMDNQNNSNAGHQNSGFSTDIANQWQNFQMYGGRTDGQSIPHFSMQNQRPSSEDGFYTGIQNVGDQRNQFGVLQQPTKVTPESSAPFSDTKQLQQNILNSIGLGTLSQQPKTDNQGQMSDKHNLFAEPSATGNLSSSNANKQNDSAALIHNILNKGQNSFPELMAAGRGFSALPSRIGPGISSEKTAMDASKQHLSSDKFTGQFMDDSKSSPFMKAETKKEMSQWANSIQQETGLVNNQKAFEMDGKMDNTLMMSRDKFINSENRPFDQFPPRGPSAEKMNRSLGTGPEISSDLGVPGIARQEPPFSGRTGGRHPGEAEQGGRFSMERFPERISDRFNENVRPGPEDSMPSTRYPPDEESEPSMAEPRQGRFHQIRGRPDDRFNDERQFPAPPGDHRFPPDDRRMLNRGPGFPLEPFSEGDKKFPPRAFDNQFPAEDQRYGPDNRGFPPGLEGRKFPPDDGRFPPDKRMQHDTEGFLGRHPGDNPFAPDDARFREREEELRQRAMAFERGRRPDERYMYEGHRGDMEYEEQGEGRFIPPDHRLGPDRGFREGDEREFRGPFPLMGDRRDGPSRWDHFGGEGEGNFQRGGPRAPLLDNPEMLGSRRHDRPPHSMGSEEPMDMDQRAGRGMDEMKGPGFEERRLGFGGRGGPGFDGRPGPGFDGRPGPGFEGRFEGRLGPGFEGRPGPGFDGRAGPGFDGRPGPGFDGRPGFEGRGGPGFEGRPGFDGRPGFGNDGIKEGFRGAGMEGMRGRGLDGMRGRGGEGRGRGMEGRGAPGMEVPARPGMNDENRFEYGRPGPANMNDEEYGLGDHDSRFQGPVGRGGMFDRRGRGDLFIRGRSGPFGRGRGFDIDRRFDDGGPEGRFDSDARNIGRHDGPMRPGPDKAPEMTLKPGSGKGLLGDAPSVDKEKDSKSSTDKKDSENTKRDYDHRSRRSNDRDRERRSSDRRDRDRDRSRYRYERDRRRSRSRDRSSRDKDSCRSRDRSRDHGSPRRENRSRCVVLKNLPNTITYKDVRRFLHPLEIPYDGLKLINDESGQRTGEVFVQFRRTDDASRAVRRNGERLSGQQISISLCTEADFSKAVDSFVGKKEATNNPADKSSNSAAKEVDSDKIRYIVQLQNLPKMVTKQDIVQFFKGLTIENNGEACYIEFDSAGVVTGKSFVEFKSDYDYKKALTQDGSLLGSSTVRVFPGKKEEADDLKNKQQEMFQRAAIHNLSGGKVTQSLMRQQAPNTRPGLTGPRAAVANQQTSQSNRPATPVSEGTPPQVADTVCVHIQGLPLLATTQDIREFFSDCQIAMRGINIAHDGKGKPLGEGFVEFKFKSDFEKGIKKDKTSFGRHIVAVKPIAKKDMIERLENARQRGLSPPKISNQPIEDQKKTQDQAVQQPAQTQLASQKTVNAPQISGQPLNNSAVAPAGNKPVPQGVTVTPGGSKSIPPGVLNKNWFYVRCQNFPPDISIQEILNFFQGFSPIGDSIRLHYSNEGKPTGNAVVGFASADEAKKALHCLNTKPCRQNIVSLHPA